jgi:hypothetical protein
MVGRVGGGEMAGKRYSFSDSDSAIELGAIFKFHNTPCRPHLLIFTRKDDIDIFNCSVSASNLTMSPNLHTLAENAKATVRVYH